MSSQPVICWFRQDLRITDNPALTAAARNGEVIPVYILDDVNAGNWSMGAASQWWLHQSLKRLNESLQDSLQVFRGDPQQLLPALCKKTGSKAVYWNRCYEPWQTARDSRLKDLLKAKDIQCESFNGSLLWEPWQISKQDGTPYRVFTPYFNKGCLPGPTPRVPTGKPPALRLAQHSQDSDRIGQLQLLPAVNWYESIARAWHPGEQGAWQTLQTFLEQGLHNYKLGRDFPALQSVSRLSPYLHFGELSPNQVWYEALREFQQRRLEVNGEHFQRELGWREFSYYLLFHFPTLPTDNFQSKFDRFPWRDNDAAFRKWCHGQTGYPIIDAGMRELWQTGYMHNRVRMIVASFLVKNLLIHWHRGARWFWDCLVDADLANNSASWQWVAGSGADAAPYFRIFNPVTQGMKFDPQGLYVRRYVPEIAGLPDKYLHDPSSAPQAVLRDANIVLDTTYPQAVVDLRHSRTLALEAFQQLK